MVRSSWVLSLLLVVLFTSFSPQVYATEGKSCESFFKLNAGFNVTDDGNLSLRLGESKYQSVEKAGNFLINFLLGRALKVNEISQVTKRMFEDKSQDSFFIKMARAFDLSLKIDDFAEFAKSIPKTGPVLILMNHPANGRETIAMAAAVAAVRPDMKVALTALLKDFPGMADNAIFLNPSPSASARTFNKRQREMMDELLKSGGVLLAHPSGEVSTTRYSEDGAYAKDPEWRAGIAKLIENNPDVQIVPTFLGGQASPSFQKVKSMKPKVIGEILGPIFHIRELAKGQHSTFQVNVGSVLKGSDALATTNGDIMAMMAYLKARTYALKGRFEKKIDNREYAEIIAPIDPELIKKDVTKMKVLAEDKGLQVLIAEGKEIPSLLREIGRLRELNFRTVGEGSGKPFDNDVYDNHYHHVVVYKPDTGAVIGGYRIAFADQVIQKVGLDGLYNRTLFEYSNLLLSDLKNSIELGRTFVNAAGLSQKDRRSAVFFLPLVWKGIAKVLEQNPQYTKLLGPVSISNSFSDVSKVIISEYMMRNHPSDYRHYVRARAGFNPDSAVLAEARALVPLIKDQNDLFKIIKDIDGMELPPLLKSYDKLGAEYMGFNFDASFNTLDGMIIVNLLLSDRAELVKYFGEEGLQNFLRFHGLQP